MSLFWLAAAGLTALALVLLWPALRQRKAASADVGQGNLGVLKDQRLAIDAELASGTLDAEQHRLARDELAQRLLEEDELAVGAVAATPRGAKRGPLWLGLAVPLLAFGIYGVLGNRDALNPPAPVAESAPKFSQAEIETMLTTLQKRLDSNPQLPDALKGWTMLARSYAAMQRFPEARVAYGRAIAMAPNDAQLLADQADVIAMVQGQKTAGEPAELIARALQLDPKNLKALALAGSAAYERKDFAGAVAQWRQARALAPADSEFIAGLDRSIADARAEGGLPDDAPKLASSAMPGVAPAGPSASGAPMAALRGRVTLAPALAANVAPGDTLFVFARAAEGPRMPLAILKRPVSELPLNFRLDDSMAMSPEMTLSKFNRVVVVARISRSGSAMPAPGDLQGQTAALTPGAANIDLVIDGVQP